MQNLIAEKLTGPPFPPRRHGHDALVPDFRGGTQLRHFSEQSAATGNPELPSRRPASPPPHPLGDVAVGQRPRQTRRLA